jgi:hypothetical protein
MKFHRTICLFLFIAVISGCSSTPEMPPDHVPLPQDLDVRPPDPSLPLEIKAFSGKWRGMWNETLPHALVVEQIIPPDVIAVFATGVSIDGIGTPLWVRVSGTVKPGILKLTLRNGTATYRLKPDGTLLGIREESGRIAAAKMQRTQ